MNSAALARRTHRLAQISVLLILGLIALLAQPARAQGGATIVGTVTDPTGAVLPGAKITLTNTATGFIRAAESNEAGNYSAPELPVGQYNIKVEAQ